MTEDTAVFARTEKGDWHRVSDPLTFSAATALYTKLGDPFQGHMPCQVGFWESSDHTGVIEGESVRHLAVRALAELGKESTGVLVRNGEAISAPRAYVQLSATDRSVLARLGRKAGDLESANDAIMTTLLDRPDTAHLDAATISDYAWSLARFCFPAEARYC